jgi:hypothetical protein
MLTRLVLPLELALGLDFFLADAVAPGVAMEVRLGVCVAALRERRGALLETEARRRLATGEPSTRWFERDLVGWAGVMGAAGALPSASWNSFLETESEAESEVDRMPAICCWASWMMAPTE